MAIDIERLLKLTADYHHFCNDDPKVENADIDEELSEESLDLVAAARQDPTFIPGQHGQE